MLRKGMVVELADSGERGVVIDRAVYHPEHGRFMLTNRKDADYVRVWTKNAIRYWPRESVSVQE